MKTGGTCAAAGLLAALFLCGGCAGPSGAPLRSFAIGREALDPAGGHVQGVAAAPDALYVAQQTRLIKTDWTGRTLKTRDVPKHTGDLAWHDGLLYTALAADGKGRIQVYDGDLNLVREAPVDRGVDGITILDGVLYLGMGAWPTPQKAPHRENTLGRFDLRTLTECTPRVPFDYGYETNYGFQNITTDGRRLYASFYAVRGAPQVAVFDKGLCVVATHHLKANQGLDVLPTSLTGGRLLFVRATTHLGADKKIQSCSFDFWSPEAAE